MCLSYQYVAKLFKWLGTYSACIFVCHPIARKVLVSLHVTDYGIYTSLIFYTLLTLVIAIFYQRMYKSLLTKYIKQT